MECLEMSHNLYMSFNLQGCLEGGSRLGPGACAMTLAWHATSHEDAHYGDGNALWLGRTRPFGSPCAVSANRHEGERRSGDACQKECSAAWVWSVMEAARICKDLDGLPPPAQVAVPEPRMPT